MVVNGAPEVAAFGCAVRFVSGSADRVTRIVLDGTEGPVGNVFGVLFGFANFHKAENPEIQAAVGALGAAGGDEAATKEALAQLNTAIVESGWLLPLYEQLAPWAYDTATVAEPTFPGAEAFPILSTIQPAG